MLFLRSAVVDRGHLPVEGEAHRVVLARVTRSQVFAGGPGQAVDPPGVVWVYVWIGKWCVSVCVVSELRACDCVCVCLNAPLFV